MNKPTIFFNKTHQLLTEATTPEQLFGDLSDCTLEALKRCFRSLAQQVHPDHHPENKREANEAFLRLRHWYQLAQTELSHLMGGLTIQSKRFTYVTTAVPTQGDLCNIHMAKSGNKNVILKIVRQPKNNDLMQAESHILKQLQQQLQDDPLKVHFPKLIETFKLRDTTGIERIINVLEPESELISLAKIMKAHPKGIHPADAAWMVNRMLAILGKTHNCGVVHGAVLPNHMLVDLSDHNGKLIDWCYARPIGKSIKAISPAYKSCYPPEVISKQAAGPATDIYMAAMTFLALLGGDVPTKQLPQTTPKAMVTFIQSCLIQSPHRRPNDAWELFDTFQEILGHLYGAPTFRPFKMP